MAGAASMAAGWELGQMDAHPGTKTSSSVTRHPVQKTCETGCCCCDCSAVRYDWISATEDWSSRIAAVNCSGVIAADAEEDTMAAKDPWKPEISDTRCYVAARVEGD